MTKVYKAVLVTLRQEDEKDNQQFTSLFTPEQFAVEYMINKRVYPTLNGSLLYAFKDLESAQAWIGDNKDPLLKETAVLRVYESDAEVVNIQPSVTYEDIATFWYEHWYEYDLGYPYTVDAPAGTVYCTWIKLLNEVGWDGRVLRPRRTPKKKETPQRRQTYAW